MVECRSINAFDRTFVSSHVLLHVPHLGVYRHHTVARDVFVPLTQFMLHSRVAALVEFCVSTCAVSWADGGGRWRAYVSIGLEAHAHIHVSIYLLTATVQFTFQSSLRSHDSI